MASIGQVRRAMDQWGAQLEGKANVVGMGAVPAKQGRSGQYDLAVYVDRKVDASQLSDADKVPERVMLPGRGRDVSIDVQVIEQGRFEPQRGEAAAGLSSGPDCTTESDPVEDEFSAGFATQEG